MFKRKLGLGLLLLAAAGGAFAGASDDAQARFKAIAAGDVEQIMAGYGDGATLQWVGGPLNGSYTGADKLKEVWTKFAKNNTPAEVTVSRVEESANPSGATVTANVLFKSKSDIKVRYALVYRDGKLVNEVWQIDPKLMY
jgi:hypothetical protein